MKMSASGAEPRQTFSELFNTYHISLCFFAEGILKDQAKAEDAVAIVFEALWASGNWKNIESPSSYLYRAVLNTCQNMYRSSQNMEKYHKAAGAIDLKVDDSILERIYRAEVYRELFTAIDKLPGQCRQVIRLSYQEGLKVEEIAKIMNISPSTVKTQRARGIKILRDLLSVRAFSLLSHLL